VSTLDVVAEILREVAPRALRAREIAELAAGRLPTESKTPETVVSRDLALEVKHNGESSRFLRVDRGEFLLREALPTAFYNDNDSYAAQWTRNLIAAGEIAAGVVDERSIRDLRSADVASYRQCHFFSGIGVWSRALRDAGWPDDVNAWTGSCPCQGMSSAGRKLGFADERHLWPEWFRLIRACRPAVLFTEQVASKDGRAWLDLVLTQLEGIGYSCRPFDLPAAGVGGPHARQRLYLVAYARERGREILGASWLHDRGQRGDDAARCGAPDGGSSELGDAGCDGARQHGRELLSDETQHEERSAQGDHASVATGTVDPGSDTRQLVRGAAGDTGNFQPGDRIRLVDDSTWGGAVRGTWARDVEWIYCRPTPGNEDGCWRPVGSGVEPLAPGTSSDLGRVRTARLRGYGNSIVLPLATTFVEAVIETLADAARALDARTKGAS
jgi:DNA (cytosine-5)-methyltransferase 1